MAAAGRDGRMISALKTLRKRAVAAGPPLTPTRPTRNHTHSLLAQPPGAQTVPIKKTRNHHQARTWTLPIGLPLHARAAAARLQTQAGPRLREGSFDFSVEKYYT
jgi:hypothetical protein